MNNIVKEHLKVVVDHLDLTLKFNKIQSNQYKQYYSVQTETGHLFELYYRVTEDYIGWYFRHPRVDKNKWTPLNGLWFHTLKTLLHTPVMYMVAYYEDVKCDRCNGTGRLPQFSHIKGGICFKCHGKKKLTRRAA